MFRYKLRLFFCSVEIFIAPILIFYCRRTPGCFCGCCYLPRITQYAGFNQFRTGQKRQFARKAAVAKNPTRRPHNLPTGRPLLDRPTARPVDSCSTDRTTARLNKKRAHYEECADVGDDLFSRAAARQVSSAQLSLTTVFGMGTGGTSVL